LFINPSSTLIQASSMRYAEWEDVEATLFI
jgi:hypothetical protein